MIARAVRVLPIACLLALLPASSIFAQDVPDSVYPPLEPQVLDGEDARTTTGVQFAFGIDYVTDYIWRGLERFDEGRTEDDLVLQFTHRVGFDLGKLPHPYFDVFVNVAENDPESSFQEVRPTFGFDWPIRPFTIGVGHFNTIFPDRERLDSAEVFLSLKFDDSVIWRTDQPIVQPYILASYDYDAFDGLYVESGLIYEREIERTGLSVKAQASVAYVSGREGQFGLTPQSDSGFQHYQIGLTARYAFNNLLNIPERFGRWSVQAYLNYTDNLDRELLGTTQVWGGFGIRLEN